MLRSWIVATVLALSLPAVVNECTAPEDKKLLYFVLDTAIARNEEMPSKERISRYADAISAADGKKDRMAKNLACVLLASSLSFAGQIDSRIDLLAGCSSKTIELARQREYPGAAPGFEEKHGDFLPIFRVPPKYPRKAREKGQSGVVVAIFTVTKGGRVKSPKVLASSDKVFDKAVLQAVRKFRYKTRVIDGKAVAVPQVTTIVHMMLEGDESYAKELNCS